jgi:hypothetical protein
MSLGSILLTPQPLALPLVLEKDRAVRAAQEFVSRLIREVTAGGRGLQILSDALTAALADLIGELESRLAAAVPSLEPLLSSVKDMFDLSGADTPAAAIQKITDSAGKIADDLTPAEIGRVLGDVLDVIENDLGLNQTRMQALFTSVASQLVDGFKADFRANPADPAAYNRYALGSALEELLDALPFPTLPPLTRSEIVARIVNALQSSQFDAMIGPIRDGIKYAATALSGVGGLAHFFPNEAFGPASVGAAQMPQKYCWYGSWLANDFTQSADAPNCDIVTDVNFGPKLTLDVMDKIAKHSKWGADTLQFILHAQSIEKGNFVSNLLNMGYRLIEIGINLFANSGVPTWVPWVGVPVLTFLGGLERARFTDAFGLTLILADGGEAQLYARWTFIARELLMSILTLSNFDKDKFAQFQAANPVQNMKAAFDEKVSNYNHNQIDGIALAFGEIGAMIMPLIVRGTDKDDYGFPDGGGSWGTQVGFALLGAVFSIGFALAGGFGIGAAIAGKAADANRIISILTKERILGRLTFSTTGRKVLDTFRIIPVIVTYLVDYFIYLFLFIENATEAGKFASKQRKTALGINEYPGYPDHTTSPYRLPYAKGTLQQCAQGNLGIVSHTPVSFQSQVYAYDFSLDDDTEIHAARAGIVVDFRDDVADGTSATSGSAANFIQIVHDTHVAGHDFDEKGGTADSTGAPNTLATMCEYLHGKKGTVTAAFAAQSPPVNIKQPGSVAGIPAGWPFAVAVDVSGNLINDPATGKPQLIKVVRGQVIMHADSTGRTAFNHLHIHVYPTTGTMTGPNPSVTKGGGSIPFVCGDDDVGGDNGVPKSFKWYESGNDS